MLNLKIYAVLAIIIAGGGYFFKQYYDSSQAQILTLKQNNIAVEAQNKAQDERFDKFKTEFAVQSAAITQLNSELANIKIESSKLSKTLARHELDKLSAGKPGLIKRLANRATKKVFANLENASKPVEVKK